MAFIKRYKPRARRVRRRRVYRGRRRRYTNRRIPAGVPKMRQVKLYYSDLNSVSISAGSTTDFIYQSSLYDPYQPTGGHQPLFFDQYAAMYNYYTVMGIAYTVNICTDAATNGPLIICVFPSDSSSAITSLSSVRERAGCKETIVSHGYRGFVKGYVSVKKVLGLTRQKLLSDDQYSARTNANPAQPMYLHIAVFNPSGGSTIAVYMSCRLTYYARLYQSVEVSQS